MVTLEDLMQHGSRRKVEGIAAKMGYPKGTTQFPDEVLEEVKNQCGKKRSVSAKAADAAEDEAVSTAEADLKSIEVAAENRAAGMLVALDTLTMVKCATRKFSDSNLQQAVDESQGRLRQFLSGVATVYDPEAFLAQTPLALEASGESGSMRSLPVSSNSPKSTEKESKQESGRKSSAGR
ncbi:hypothetical protein Glo7428_4916 (plasmid) [Gloeocapsa sp. PCC 7428]|uniref:hypothetical protein n=1 Tax=Gloeocapsa sp. PCC 7428 TaxID=1173026 RepID=UPI0002A5FB8B|nr:hypothetical protein [Gloeocapsa sp. PCC 7428]AFZ33335.1 hypothetical protein Glo7428_4916 [Gloeocapsa sp. PCC 7428]